MEYNQLGQTGLRVSKFGLGAMNFGSRVSEEDAFLILDKASELGMNFIDTANAYGKSEEILGKWFKKEGNRENFILSTKVGWPMGKGINERGLSRQQILKQVNRSLKQLQTDYIDIYQPHYIDDSIDLQTLASTFSQLVDQEKIHIIGSYLFGSAWKMLKWHYIAKENGFNNIGFKQLPFSLLSRSIQKGDTVELGKELNLAMACFGVIGGGLLTGKYTSDKPFPENGKEMMRETQEKGKTDTIIEKLSHFAKDKNVEIPHLSVSWVNHHDFHQTMIVGASSPHHLESIQTSLEIDLSEEEFKILSEWSEEHHIW